MSATTIAATYAEFKKNGQRFPLSKASTPTTALAWIDLFSSPNGGLPGVGTVTATGKANGAVVTKANVGAPAFQNPRSGRRLYLVGGKHVSPSVVGHYIIGDRIAHVTLAQNEASGLITGLDATSRLAAAGAGNALEGCEAFVSVQTALGATDNVYTIGYTNQDGTASRTSQQFTVRASTGVSRFATTTTDAHAFIGLQGDDRSIRSIERIDLISGTGTGGTFNLVLFRPILDVALSAQYELDLDYVAQCSLMPEVLPDSAITVIGLTLATVLGLSNVLSVIDL